MSKSMPNVAAAFQICEEIVEGVLDQTENGSDLESLDTASLAHLMAAVQLMTMRGLNSDSVHILIESLYGMLVDRKSDTTITQVDDEPLISGVKH